MRTLVLVLATGLALTGRSFGQDRPVLRRGAIEVGAFAGASHGIDEFRVMGGGNVSYGITKWLLPYGEFSYFPGLGRERTDPTGSQRLSYVAPLYDLHGGLHFRAPVPESKVVPYGVFGLGVIHSSFQGVATITLPNVAPTPFPLNEHNTDLAVNFGGGLRSYVNQRWGFRIEAKTYRPVTGRFDNFFYKAEAGIFFQIR